VATGVALALLVALVVVLSNRTLAAWTAATGNSGNSLPTASTFPNYTSSVTNDSAWAYLRAEETPSSSSTLTAADSSGNNRTGT